MNNTGEALKTVDTSASIIFFPELNVMAIITFAAEESEGQRGQVTLQKVKGSRIFFFFFFFFLENLCVPGHYSCFILQRR